MKLKKLYLRDFGIFNHQRLPQIAPGIVVIGGFNRSGKTTLLNILRYLGYGFPRDGSLPSPAQEYDVEADLVSENHQEYRVNIRGFGEPVVTCLSEENKAKKDIRELYGGLDKFTYRQLFTLSLDELQQKPPGVTRDKEQERLYSVLLGAGLSQVMRLPEIARRYFRRARDLGGKHGRPGVGEFKHYHKMIARAEKKKKEALQQVDEYLEVESQIQDIKEELQELENKIQDYQEKSTRLDVLKNNYESFSQLKKIEREKKEHQGKEFAQDKYASENVQQAENYCQQYETVCREYGDCVQEFMTRVKPRDREQTKNNLLQNQDLLKKHVSRLAGYREKVNNYQEQQDEQELKYRQLELEAGEINFYWQDNLEEITEIRTDKIEKGKLISQIQEVQDLNQQLERIIEKKKQLLEEKNVLQTHLQQEKEGQPEQVLKKTFLLGTAGILLGAAGSWIFLPVGLIIGFGSLIFTLIYYLSFYQEELQLARDRQQLKEDLEIVTGKIEEKDKEIKNLKNKLRPAEQVLDHYRDLLGLPQDESQAGELIKDYFVSIKQLQQRYHEWQLGQKKLNQKKEKLQEELATLLVYLTRLEDNFCDDRFALPPETDIIDYSADLFSALDKAAEYLELARELEEKEYQKKNIEQEVKDFFAELDFSVNDDITQTLYRYLNNAELAAEYKGLKEDYKAIYRQLVETLSSADRIKTAFLAYDNHEKEFNLQASVEEEKLLRNFAELCQQFTSREEITTRHQQVTAELKEFKQNRDSLKDQLTSLNKKKEELSSPQKIEDAHQEKNQARSELRTLAERYAVRKSVSFILNKVRERAISRARKDLLQPAGQLLQEMTAGEYQKIEPPENMGATNFKTILRKNKQQKDVGSLSRGTREQLFLAIRISRIREIEPALPVVLDDSLVNFDHLHLQQASEILSRLGESHQIFVLTCHPHLVDYISSSSSGAQYWQLEQGNFSQTSAEKLSAYLSGTGQKK